MAIGSYSTYEIAEISLVEYCYALQDSDCNSSVMQAMVCTLIDGNLITVFALFVAILSKDIDPMLPGPALLMSLCLN